MPGLLICAPLTPINTEVVLNYAFLVVLKFFCLGQLVIYVHVLVSLQIL